jgi:hypothetical protein
VALTRRTWPRGRNGRLRRIIPGAKGFVSGGHEPCHGAGDALAVLGFGAVFHSGGGVAPQYRVLWRPEICLLTVVSGRPSSP